jgi:3-oxoacyl-[acyl-carrier protein] reductase
MDLGLRGKKALITGASRGIGRACAEVLASEGCDVVIVSRTQADLDAARDKILGQSNVSVCTFAMDLSDSKNADILAAECPDTDILINNAGAIPRGTVVEIDEARWREAWDLKVFGYINMCRRFYALMAVRRSGVIINIIGAAGETVQSSYACGSAGNASLMGFTRALGGTAPHDGMRVVGLNPGPVETDRMVTRLRREANAKFGDPERWRELTSHMAFGRAATGAEIANMAAFLASNHSGYTTGTIVTVDGGGTSRASAL